ncbi:uncharacterized protein MYCFIDRAFT_193309 [Pseudocercospora fijiensis CIRAD86]|uniref:Uncharacterized protein n=1 Tax=Pseudocercospora fijiensis (strain CIRAD86) TaxID=383855 RepID=N1QBC6_PSEFD|nr:uncharacterized protein MYCFIDRAFT_193309 [Pseudocercospora fijiensis CIRAD86]EME89381.1 hypothetical protein MYCFIDRAFT_193309 [Pseudocercospora fijiensis CIRAD86]
MQAQRSEDANLRSTDVEDAIGDMASKICRKSKAESAMHDAERETLKHRLQQALDRQGLLQGRLKAVEQENENLSAAMNEQAAKLFGHRSKTSRLKAFVDGLGNDLAVVRKDSFAQRQQTEQLIGHVSLNRLDHTSLLQQMSACTERSTQLKAEALKALRETNEKLAVATVRSSTLEEQVHEKGRLLSEEKQLRLHLLSRLKDEDASSGAITRQMKTASDTILDKLLRPWRKSPLSRDLWSLYLKARSFEVRFKDAQKKEAELEQQIVTLKEQVAAQSNSKIEPAEGIKLSDALKHAEAQLQRNVEQIVDLTTAKSTLEEKLRLVQQSNEAPELSATLTNAEVQRQVAHKIDQIRTEMARHNHELQTRDSADTDNENKRLVHESARLARDVRSLENKLASANADLEMYRAQFDSSNREVEGLKRMVNAREAEVSGFGAAQSNLEAVQDDLEKSRDKVKALNERLAAGQKEGERAVEQIGALRRVVETLPSKVHSGEDRESKLRTQVTGLQGQVRRAHEDAKRVEVKYDTERHKAKAAVEKTATELRARLSEATEELMKARAENTGFLEQVGFSWQETAKSHEQTVIGLKADLVKAEAAKNVALLENQKPARGMSPHRDATETIPAPVVQESQVIAHEHTLPDKIRGAVVEESQDVEPATTPRTSSPLTAATVSAKRVVAVPGTQADSCQSSGMGLQRMDPLPSFAAFNNTRQASEPDFSIYEDAVNQSDPDNAMSRSGQDGSGKKQKEAVGGLKPARGTVKRKADSQIIDGYEHERKQRRAAASDATSHPQSKSLGLVRRSSVKDLPSIPRSMHSSAGTTARQTRAAKRLTTSKKNFESREH